MPTMRRMITFNGETLPMTHWARRLGVGVPAMSSRLKKLPIEKALTLPSRYKKRKLKTADCHPQRPNVSRGLCRQCYKKKMASENPEHWKRNQRRTRLRRAFGITIEQYELMWDSQGGRCANSGCSFAAPKIPKDYRMGLLVDHNHLTGQVRGLLCPQCNFAVGNTKEREAALLGLVEYLSKFKK